MVTGWLLTAQPTFSEESRLGMIICRLGMIRTCSNGRVQPLAAQTSFFFLSFFLSFLLVLWTFIIYLFIIYLFTI
jgi:hypothetical protein